MMMPTEPKTRTTRPTSEQRQLKPHREYDAQERLYTSSRRVLATLNALDCPSSPCAIQMPQNAFINRAHKRRSREQQKHVMQHVRGMQTKITNATPQNTHSTHHPITSA